MKQATSTESNSKSPRILLITDRYLPEVGGSITWFDCASRRYPPNTVWILTKKYPNAEVVDQGLARLGVSVTRRDLRRYRFLKPESLLMYIKLFFTAVWIVLRHRIDVIYAGKVLPEGMVARVVGRFLRRPYIVFAHGEEITVFGKNPKLGPKLPGVYDSATAVIANSSFTMGTLVEYHCSGKNAVKICPGVDPGVFTPGPRDQELVKRYDLEGKTVLLSVGRHQKRKGHDHVIMAMPRILKSCPNLVYVVTSNGEEEAYLHRLAGELGVSGSVRFTGEVPLEDLPRFYKTCDIFILANRLMEDGDVEGFGIVYLEASASRKPTIAGDSGGTGDPVRHGWNGLRVDARDPDRIAEAVLQLAQDPALRETMGKNGRELVEAEFTWDRVVQKMLTLDRAVARGEALPSWK